jgi:hypothetical protein
MSIPNVDPCTSLPAVKIVLGIQPSKTLYDFILNQLIAEVSAAIQEHLGRTVMLASNPANPITWMGSGPSEGPLILRDRPVQAPIYTGNTVAGSSVVTGMSSTKYLFAGQGVSCIGSFAIQPLTTIATVGTGTITLSQAAALTGLTTLSFGANIVQDDLSYGGSVPGSFSSPSSQLYYGNDYWIDRDQPDSSSRCGCLWRINQTWSTKYYAPGINLSTVPINGQGNLMVTYCAGWDKLPYDITLAAERMVAQLRASTRAGSLLSNLSYEGAALSMMQQQIKYSITASEAGGLLAPYVNAN